MNELLDGLDLEESSEESKPRTNRVEQAIVLMADTVWAVVGLLLWIPQIVRVVVTSAVRLVHAALTRQPIDGLRGPIRRVSRFYIDGFLSPGKEKDSTSYRSRELRVGRFVVEALWVVAVWLAVLQLVSKEAFASVWQQLARLAAWSWAGLAEMARDLAERLPESLQVFGSFGTGPSIALAIILVIFLAAGFLLGRRSR